MKTQSSCQTGRHHINERYLTTSLHEQTLHLDNPTHIYIRSISINAHQCSQKLYVYPLKSSCLSSTNAVLISINLPRCSFASSTIINPLSFSSLNCSQTISMSSSGSLPPLAFSFSPSSLFSLSDNCWARDVTSDTGPDTPSGDLLDPLTMASSHQSCCCGGTFAVEIMRCSGSTSQRAMKRR